MELLFRLCRELKTILPDRLTVDRWKMAALFQIYRYSLSLVSQIVNLLNSNFLFFSVRKASTCIELMAGVIH